MVKKRKAVDIAGLNPKTVEALDQLGKTEKLQVNQGTFGERRVEPVPNFIQAGCEQVINNKNNAWIVLGRDRPGSLASGYGGRGDTQAAAIDLVVGRMSYNPVDSIHVDPNIKSDAARIYISQKTDIDENFNLTEGTIGSVKTKSGIGIKADGVRIVAREGIKIVTTTDSLTSHGGKVESIGNIDLIAGNDGDKLEPLVKGKRLINALAHLGDQLNKVTENLNSFLTYQMAFNTAIVGHTHGVACMGGGVAVPSVTLSVAGATAMLALGSQAAPSTVINVINQEGWQLNYLNDIGDNYICSRNVNVT